MTKQFIPDHMNATAEDMQGNNGIGRYFLLPGSDGRAKDIAQNFDNLVLKPHPRGHNLYLGTLTCEGKKIDVATISSGMGCPSMEIVLHELFHLGAKRFLRIGTAGTLQPKTVKPGQLINVQASVRDESTTTAYLPVEVPAIASLEFNSSILLAAAKLKLSDHIHTGIVHCKSALYAREFGAGPQAKVNEAYINLLSQAGVLASEMETAALFIQSMIYNHQLMQEGETPQHRVLAGAILTIVPSPTEAIPRTVATVQNAINLALETIKTLAIQELFN